MQSLIEKMIQIAFFLAAIGQLKPATLWLVKEIAIHQQSNQFSLGKFNRALIGEPHHVGVKK